MIDHAILHKPLLLCHLTLIKTIHIVKLSTIPASKVMVDVTQLSLPLTTFLLVSTVHDKIGTVMSQSACLLANATNCVSRLTGHTKIMADVLSMFAMKITIN